MPPHKNIITGNATVIIPIRTNGFDVFTVLDIIKVITGCIRYIPKEYRPIHSRTLDPVPVFDIFTDNMKDTTVANMTYRYHTTW